MTKETFTVNGQEHNLEDFTGSYKRFAVAFALCFAFSWVVIAMLITNGLVFQSDVQWSAFHRELVGTTFVSGLIALIVATEACESKRKVFIRE